MSKTIAASSGLYGKPGQSAKFPFRFQLRCDQCQAAMINGVFCHETGCPNQRKTWVEEREEWVRFFECFECGFDVAEGDTCDCRVQEGEEN